MALPQLTADASLLTADTIPEKYVAGRDSGSQNENVIWFVQVKLIILFLLQQELLKR